MWHRQTHFWPGFRRRATRSAGWGSWMRMRSPYEVRTGVIALTKADLADAEMRELAREETRELVRGTFLAEAPIIEVSSTTGEGLEALRTALCGLAAALPARPADGPVRLPARFAPLRCAVLGPSSPEH